MTMDFVPFELSKKLKEKGFNEQCLAYYTKDSDFYYNTSYDSDVENAFKSFNSRPNHICGKRIDAPTISQVLKWLRDEKNIICLPHIEPIEEKWFFYVVRLPQASDFPEYMSLVIYDTYEEAAIAGIEHALYNLI